MLVGDGSTNTHRNAVDYGQRDHGAEVMTTPDGVEFASDNGVRYPLTKEPETGDGSVVEVAPGILWLRMPLAGPLRWINVWALADKEGWTVVDTGVHSAGTITGWQQAFQGALQDKPVVRVIVTHMHPDHCGMAGWLTERFDARLWMTRLEYLTCRLMAADTKVPAEGIDFFQAAGWDAEFIEHYRAKFGYFGKQIHPLPFAYRRIVDQERILIGAHEWIVVMGNGHSPEHACLYCPERQLLISGDQVLPRISSNISVYPTEPDSNPLLDWLTSLQRIKTLVPDSVLVLPSHNSPFFGLHARLDQLLEHHRRSLDRLIAHIAVPQRVVDVFTVLFKRPISADIMNMATGEAVAHLNYLLFSQQATRERDSAGVWRWRSSAGSENQLSRCLGVRCSS
jgi:glyoxylase-like metal-dependent hydrolase (beta-lactamase superfamily II)